MKKEKQTLVLGAGFSGKAYGRHIVEKGGLIFGTTRSQDKANALQARGIKPIIFNGTEPEDELVRALEQITDLIISIAPDSQGDPTLRSLKPYLIKAEQLQWIGYLSTVGVYGNHDGAWVDEMTECRPVSDRSVQRMAAETEWIDFAASKNIPLGILRLSGIYGPGRNALKNMMSGKARRLVKPGQVFNRIHVVDIAGSLAHLADMRAHGIYNVTDDMPAPPQDVVEYAATVTKIDPPDEINFQTATLSPMARSFYGENKRVSNAKLKQTGYIFKYPNYRFSLQKMWDDNDWR